MFSDFGHGLILLLTGVIILIYEKKIINMRIKNEVNNYFKIKNLLIILIKINKKFYFVFYKKLINLINLKFFFDFCYVVCWTLYYYLYGFIFYVHRIYF